MEKKRKNGSHCFKELTYTLVMKIMQTLYKFSGVLEFSS